MFSMLGAGCAGPGTEGSGTAGMGGTSAAGSGGPAGQAGTGAGGSAAGSGSGGSTTGAGGDTSAGSGGSVTGGGGNTPAGTGGSSTGLAGSGPGGGGAAGAPGGSGGQAAAGRGGGGGAAGTAPPAEPKLITSSQSAFWQTTGTLTEVTSGTIDVTVSDTAQQNWDGMGGTFNEAGWNVLMMLSAADRDRAIKLLFDATEGARFQYGRLPVGASDYAVSRYTLNETANDTAMSSFSIARDKQYLIPYIKAALAIKPDIHLWASPWTPPSWMKSNNAIDGGNMRETAAMFDALALYLAKFVEAYAAEGITIEAIHPQNEPGYETRYPSCLWTAAGMTTFIGSHLGPLFASRLPNTRIYLGTMSNDQTDGAIIESVNRNATAAGFVKGYGLQWNMLPFIASMNLKSRGVPILQTEHKCGNYHWNPMGFPPFNPNMPANDFAYGVESWGYIKDWIRAGVTMYSAWNMVLDTAGKNLDTQRPWPQNALLVVNTSAKTLTATPAYYVFRHVSQYVDPGAKVVSVSGTLAGETLAFKNLDGTTVTVVYNSGAARNFIVSIGGKRLQFAMPSMGWATINWR
jgi:glucosylceramidase